MDNKKIKNSCFGKNGGIQVEDAVRRLQHLPYEDISLQRSTITGI
jgi:hypothetical protein